MTSSEQTSMQQLEASSFRPCLRADFIFGPSERSGARTIFYVKDQWTGWFYTLGQKEHFLLSRMDGSKSLQEISDEYARTFKRKMDQQAWEKIFLLIHQRQMLKTTADVEQLELLKKKAQERKRQDNKKFLSVRFPIFKPDAFLKKLLPYIRFAFHPAFVVSTSLLLVALEIFIFTQLGTLGAVALKTRSSVVSLVIFIALEWLFLAFHELSHGLACRKFGGSGTEIGIVWRYLFFFPYCKIDDVVLFHNRWYRVSTAFAGIYINLLSLLPFGLLWLIEPTGSMVRGISALMLLSFNLTTFFNFIPFIELDGYFMLNHALNRVNLRKESHLYWRKIFNRIVLRKSEDRVAYTRQDHIVYALYGALSLLFTVVFFVGAGIFWFVLFQRWFGVPIAIGIQSLLIIVILALGPGKNLISSRIALLNRKRQIG